MSEKYNYPFQNPDLPLAQRVTDLVSRFTLDEKINLMCQYQDAIPRLGVRAYKHGTEAAHGMAWLGEATSFPQPIGLACTWDTELLLRIGSVIGDEARGFFKKNPAINGLTLWAPTVDMERDPRWGRTEEAYGEDPHLTGKLASALVRGLQGDDPFYLKSVASLKHFIGNNNEINRGECSVSIDPRNMKEYYLKAFEIPFKEGKAQSMMTAYNSVNGVPANLNPDVNHVVKKEWGMDGFVVSDAGDVLGTVNDHKYVDSYKEAVALTIKAGVDSITDDHDISKQAIRDALADGMLTENDLDIALANTFRVRFRLGEFDPDSRNPYAAIEESVILQPEHVALSLEAVRKSVVLLKNDGALPLQADKLKKVAVIGPLGGKVYRDWYSGTLPYAVTPLEGIMKQLSADGQSVRFANGCDRVKLKASSNGRYVSLTNEAKQPLAANQSSSDKADLFEVSDWGWDSHTLIAEANGRYVTTDDVHVTASSEHIWEWFTKEVFHVRYGNEAATLTTWNDRPVKVDANTGALQVQEGTAADAESFTVEKVVDGLNDAVEAAREADVAVVFVGNHPLINGKETIDRPDLTLAASQERLVKEVFEANPNTIVVIVGSYPYAIGWINEHIPAIVYSSHAGHEMGTALTDVLFGNYNPAGRLNMTWYQSVDQLGEFMDYDIIKRGRTYQYFAGKPLYSFGHGLSYTSFEYDGLQLDTDHISEGGTVSARLRVSNTGDRYGEEVIQLYTQAGPSRVKRPLRQLQGFQRVALGAGESAEVSFELKASDLVFWDVTREKFCLESGYCTMMFGSSSSNTRLSRTINVDGENIPARNLLLNTKAVNYDDYEGVLIGENTEGGNSVVTSSTPAWIRFDDVILKSDIQSFEARLTCTAEAAIEIRLDSPEGPLAGICAISGADTGWRTLTCDVELPDGQRSIYLVLKGDMRIGSFQFRQ
ncbi:glycoside hydrolase family 3 protein [Cohnella luojiensis]|uniref:Carbohydrate-binding protein n=1 Tax=Cohnella luojiensis TaxID=652876 RepID=A0A4Y8M6D2_9BACL|nr:glycoside hydrolase family 3 protein [Cohnella luojiensis]TFE30080.1 carbohydrate-binding protein [Cohnella luojiensis]